MIEYVEKIPNTPGTDDVLRQHRGKIAADARSGRLFRLIVRPDMNYRLSNGKTAHARSEEVHGSQDEFPGIIHRLGDAIQKRRTG
jgi:hypothetical protein